MAIKELLTEIFSESDIEEFSKVLVEKMSQGKLTNSQYKQMISGFNIGWKQFKNARNVDFEDNSTHKRLLELGQRMKELGPGMERLDSRLIGATGMDIGVLVGILHYHPLAILRPRYISQVAHTINALRENEWFGRYTLRLIGKWNKRLKEIELTGRQKQAYEALMRSLVT